MKITYHSIKKLNIPAEFIAEKIHEVVRNDFVINVIGVSKSEIQELNKEYRKKDEATDVLSFESTIEGETGGDIYICIDVISNNADRFGVSMEEELVRTIVHGILHLAGFDHTGKLGESNEEMFEIQEKIVKEIFK